MTTNMKEILLVSEKFIKDQTDLSDNISSKFLLPAIREAQEINLRSILGDKLLDALKNAALEGLDIPKNAKWKSLVTNVQYFLTYQTLSNILLLVAVKVDNLGVSRATDDNIEAVDFQDLYSMKGYWQSKADWYAKRLQSYILKNRSLYPELDENDCYSIQSNMYATATCGLWLGGARGSNRMKRYNIERNNQGSSSASCNKQYALIESSNENSLEVPSAGYDCFSAVEVEGYDVDEVHDKLKNI